MNPNALRIDVMDELAPVVEALRQTLGENLIALALFGSRARGDAKPDSDWDLLVIARYLPPGHMARYRMLKEQLPPFWRGRVSILAKTPAEFEAALPSLYLDIALDGRILYDPFGYAQDRLLRLRRLIQAKGLRREKRGEDFVWEWETFPGFGWSLRWEEVKEQ